MELRICLVSLSSIFAISGYEPFSFGGFVKAINPVESISFGFTSCFLIYYLLIPFLNKLVNNIDKKQHLILLAICVLFFVIWDRLPGIEYTYNYVGWFCVLHFIASYIRSYVCGLRLFKHEAVLIITGGAFAILSVIGQCFMIEQGWHVGW